MGGIREKEMDVTVSNILLCCCMGCVIVIFKSGTGMFGGHQHE
jgi:hypothetical protein